MCVAHVDNAAPRTDVIIYFYPLRVGRSVEALLLCMAALKNNTPSECTRGGNTYTHALWLRETKNIPEN